MPKYLKSFEVIFFLVFLVLYYSVLVERNPLKISFAEILLYVWFAAFFYDELSEWSDAGSIFYAADVSRPWDRLMSEIRSNADSFTGLEPVRHNHDMHWFRVCGNAYVH